MVFHGFLGNEGPDQCPLMRIPGDVARESGMMSSTQSDLMSLGVPR
jgi:hypothetical protein